MFQLASAQSPERNLVEKLHDIEALVEVGINYTEYSRVTGEAVVLYKRYERAGGRNPRLELAVDSLVEAKNFWAEKLQAESEGQRNAIDRLIRIQWKKSYTFLNDFEKEKRKK